MIELHIELNNNFSLEQAIHFAQRGKIKGAGFLVSSLSITKEEVKNMKEVLSSLSLFSDFEAFLGAKIAYVPPALISSYVNEMREKGFDYVCVHGENIFEDIAQGTNLAAISARADILLNPGKVDKQLFEYASELAVGGKKTAFEFNVNPLFSAANTKLACYAKEFDVPLVWGNTIKEDKDILYSLIKNQYADLFLCDSDYDLIKKLNHDTFNFIQSLKS